MRLTKKHFEMLASSILDARRDCVAEGVQGAVALDVYTDRLCGALAGTNPAFNPERFRDASGYGQAQLPLETNT